MKLVWDRDHRDLILGHRDLMLSLVVEFVEATARFSKSLAKYHDTFNAFRKLRRFSGKSTNTPSHRGRGWLQTPYVVQRMDLLPMREKPCLQR